MPDSANYPTAHPKKRSTDLIVGGAGVLVALLLLLVFHGLYGTSTPITDEWLFVRSVADIDANARSILSGLYSKIGITIYDHSVGAPFLIYYFVAKASGFNAEALVLITWACYATALLVLAQYHPRPITWIVLAVILFSPSRYMDWVWGFQFAMTMSIALPMIAMGILNTINDADGPSKMTAKITMSGALLYVAAFSCAGGLVGYPAAAVLLFMRGRTTRWFSVLFLVIGISIIGLRIGAPVQFMKLFSLDSASFVLTAIGGTLLSTRPSADTAISGLPSIGGICVLAICAYAISRRVAPRQMALPISLMAFGGGL